MAEFGSFHQNPLFSQHNPTLFCPQSLIQASRQRRRWRCNKRESCDFYLNMYAEKKPEKADPSEQRLSKFTNYALSFEPLKPPCVIDKLENVLVFNKETLVKAFGHIKGVKDMIHVEFSLIPGLESAIGGSEARFQCPISSLEMNENYNFFALWSSGHVFSVEAMKEVKYLLAWFVTRTLMRNKEIRFRSMELRKRFLFLGRKCKWTGKIRRSRRR